MYDGPIGPTPKMQWFQNQEALMNWLPRSFVNDSFIYGGDVNVLGTVVLLTGFNIAEDNICYNNGGIWIF